MQIKHFFGNDITLTAEGDISISDGDELAQEAIIRRLMTNPGTYFWEPDYGAGIGRCVGENLSADNFDEIRNIITSQILLEETVAASPPPQIGLSIIGLNILQVDIVYYSKIKKNTVSISFQVS